CRCLSRLFRVNLGFRVLVPADFAGLFWRFDFLVPACPAFVPDLSRRCPGPGPRASRSCPGLVPLRKGERPKLLVWPSLRCRAKAAPKCVGFFGRWEDIKAAFRERKVFILGFI